MTIRQFGEHTKTDYIRQVREFTAFLGRSPDRAEPEDLRRYQLHLASLGASYARMNVAGTCAPVLLPHHAGPAGVRRPHGADPDARAPAGRAQPGGGGAAARPCAEPEVPGRAERRLRLRPAGLRDRQPEDHGHRQRPHADPGRTGQGTQGPLRHAGAGSARPVAPVVGGEAVARLAVPRPAARPADHDASARPRLPRRRQGREARQACVDAHAPAQLRHAPARDEDRYPRHPGPARAQEARYDRHLHTGGVEGDRRGRRARSRCWRPRHRPEVPRRAWRGLSSRSRMS